MIPGANARGESPKTDSWRRIRQKTLAGCGKTRRKTISAKSNHYYDHESALWINHVRGQKPFFRNLLERNRRLARRELGRVSRSSPKRDCVCRGGFARGALSKSRSPGKSGPASRISGSRSRAAFDGIEPPRSPHSPCSKGASAWRLQLQTLKYVERSAAARREAKSLLHEPPLRPLR